jgi:hypothetical protein
MANETIRVGDTTLQIEENPSSTVLAGDIREAIAIGGFTSIAGQPSSLSNAAYGNAVGNTNLSQQNTVAHQQAMNVLGQTVTGKTTNLLANLNPMEAVATVKLDTGNDMAEQLADLKAIISGGRVPSKHVPRIRRNPAGGYYVTVTEKDFPLTLTVHDHLRRPFATRGRKGGLVCVLKPSNYPFEISLGGPSKPLTPPITVPRSAFPVTVTLLAAPPKANQRLQVIPKDSFPVQVILGQG